MIDGHADAFRTGVPRTVSLWSVSVEPLHHPARFYSGSFANTVINVMHRCDHRHSFRELLDQNRLPALHVRSIIPRGVKMAWTRAVAISRLLP